MSQEVKEFTAQEALNVLVQAVHFAQSKGAFSLDDAEVINKAVKLFTKKEEAAADNTQAEPAAEVTSL